MPALSPSGEDASGAPVADLPTGRFLEVAFEQFEGEDGFLTETADDGFFVLRVDSITPSRQRTLEEVREDAVAGWQEDRRRTATEERAEALAEEIRGGKGISTAAQEAGQESAVGEPFSRQDGGFGGTLPRGLVDELFSLRPGEVAVGEGPGGFIVAQLKEIRPANTASAEDLRARVDEELAQAIAGDLIDQFNLGLREKHPVTVNSAMVDLVYDGLGRR